MIDWDRVEELRSEIGADDFDEVVALFLEEADEVVARLAGSAGSGALEADLHFLKGAALNLGFHTLAELCQDGERMAAEGRNDVDVEQVRQAYHSSRAQFASGGAAASAA